MAEALTLITPVSTIRSEWRVILVSLDWEASEIRIVLRSDTGERFEHRYTEAIALNLMIALNKVNLSVKSLQRRIIERLIADGVFVGSPTGTPD